MTRLLAAAAVVVPLGVALGSAPAATAQPLPEPNPVPVPQPGVTGGQSTTSSYGGESRVSAPQVGIGGASTTSSYLDPVNTVPSINGDPCTGSWESAVCYAMHFDSAPAVQPRSTITSSP